MMVGSKLKSKCYKRLLNIPNRVLDEIMFELFREFITKGDVVIEVGANVGTHTAVLAEAVGETGSVHAFEPFSANIAKLKEMLKKKKIEHLVTVHEMALSNHSGEADFKIFRDQPGICGFRERPWYDKDKMEIIRVKVGYLDNMGLSSKNIKLIKIDAEGADFDILGGSEKTIRKSVPIIVFEGGRKKSIPASLYGYTEERFKQYFSSLGYELFDNFGIKFDYCMWEKESLNDFIAIPANLADDYSSMIQLLSFSVLQKYLNFS